jgi:hypothetical protein
MWPLKNILITVVCLLKSGCCGINESPGFDRSAVESQVQETGFYRGNVEGTGEPEDKISDFTAQTAYGTYYGAAANPWFLKILPQKVKDVFPLSRAAVEGRPEGISVYSARQSLLESEKKSYQGGFNNPFFSYHKFVSLARNTFLLEGAACTVVIYSLSFWHLEKETVTFLNLW